MTALLITIFAHLVADFILQTDAIVKEKSDKQKLGFFKHGLGIFITLFILLVLRYNLLTAFFFSIVVTTVHIVLDYIKCLIGEPKSKLSNLLYFLGDQLIHILSILFIWNYFNFTPNNFTFLWSDFFLTPQTITTFNEISQSLNSRQLNVNFTNNILICGIVYISVCLGGGIFIRKFLDLIYDFSQSSQEGTEKDGIKKAGKFIGILERMLIITLVLNNTITAIGFTMTAKSVARFDKITSDKSFAEYYLIGTLTSTLLGMIGGYTLSYLLKIFS